MPAFLAPLIAGAASLIGGALANRQQSREARKAENFSEEMSNTAVRRSVDDYKAAGLNPGLAYDRSASSPGGIQAQIGNIIEPAINSAHNARSAQDQYKQNALNRELTEAQIAGTRAANARDTAQSNLTAQQAISQWMQTQFQVQLNPKLLARADIENSAMSTDALLKSLMVPGATNAAGLERMMGKLSPALTKAGNFLPALNVLRLLKR